MSDRRNEMRKFSSDLCIGSNKIKVSMSNYRDCDAMHRDVMAEVRKEERRK